MPGFDPIDFSSQPSDEHAHSNNGDAQLDAMGTRQLALAKEGHRYVFDYTPGQEPELLERLVDMAHDPNCALEMFDAAVLSHQIGIRLSHRVGEMLKS